MSSVSNGLYFLTLPLVSVMRVIYRKIRHVCYLYIKRNVEKVWGARYTLGARYLSKNTVFVTLKTVSHCGLKSLCFSVKETSDCVYISRDTTDAFRGLHAHLFFRVF